MSPCVLCLGLVPSVLRPLSSRLFSSAALVLASGAALGGWMFAWRGVALFGGIALAIVVLHRLVGSRSDRVAAALALTLAAAGMYSASTLGWGGTDVPDGSRYKASPVGLSHVLTPHRLRSETVDCGWYAISGYSTPCPIAPAGGAAFARLRAVYPLALLSAGLAAAGALTSLRCRPRVPRRLTAGCAALAALAAVGLFATSVQQALAPLAGLPFGVGGTLGTMQLAAAVLLCMSVAAAPRLEARPASREAIPA